MNTITNLAKSGVKSNKAKSILIILTIMLTTCLLTAIGIICGNWMESNLQNAIDRSGKQHVIFRRTTPDEIAKLSNHIDIEELEIVKTVGSYKKDEVQLQLQFAQPKNGTYINAPALKEGKFPEGENEILLAEGYMTALGKSEPKVGDTVEITYESNKAIQNHEENTEKRREFIVSGIYASSEANIEKKIFGGVISKDYFIKEEYINDSTFTTYGRFNNEEDLDLYQVELKLEEFMKSFGLSKYNIVINKDYLNAMKPDMTVITSAIVIALLIVFSSIIVIYSIFYIAIVNKVQEYGKLRAVGATKKQIRKLILKEGMFLSLIAIPLGLLLGYVIGDLIICKIIIQIPQEGKYTIPVLIMALVASFITVLISILKPMRIASRISPVEAMRYDNDDNAKKKHRKGYEEMSVAKLTKANLSRNRKRSIITLTSLTLSGILFITASTIMSAINADTMTEGHMGDAKFNLSLSSYSLDSNDDNYLNLRGGNPLTEYIDMVKGFDGVKDVKIHESTLIKYIDTDEWYDVGAINKENEKSKTNEIVAGEINLEKLKNEKGIILNHGYTAEVYGIKVGDKISFEIIDGDKKSVKEFEIMAITNGHGSSFLIHEDVYNEIFTMDTNSSAAIIIEDSKYDEIKPRIKEIENQNPFIRASYYDEVHANNILAVGATKLMAYALVIVIGIIGFINLINTMITSIVTRRKELGMLQAIGLSNKQFISMIQREGLFYTLTTLGITLTLGNTIAYIAYLAFKNSGASYAAYSYPMIPTIILIVATLGAQLILAYLVSKSFNKQSLVDRVRYSE